MSGTGGDDDAFLFQGTDPFMLNRVARGGDSSARAVTTCLTAPPFGFGGTDVLALVAAYHRSKANWWVAGSTHVVVGGEKAV